MKITHVLRGEDLLPSTPRQIALYQALIRIGVAERVPEFAHLPTRSRGGHQEAVQARSAVEPVPAPRPRLHPRGPAELSGAARLVDRRRPRRVQPRRDGRRVRRRRRQLQPRPLRPEEGRRAQRRAHPAADARRLHRTAARRTSPRTATTPGSTTRSSPRRPRLVQTRIVVLGDAWDLLKFLNDDEFALDEKAAAKELRADAGPVLDAALAALEGVGGLDDRRRSKPRSRPRCWRTWRSSRARRSARSGWRPPAHRSARRCSSRWSCSAATAACTGCARAATVRRAAAARGVRRRR